MATEKEIARRARKIGFILVENYSLNLKTGEKKKMGWKLKDEQLMTRLFAKTLDELDRKMRAFTRKTRRHSDFFWSDPEFGKESMGHNSRKDRGGGWYIKKGKHWIKTKGSPMG